MTESTTLNFFPDAADRTASEHMALDEALLRSVEPDELILRVYTWSRPATTIGYFQPLRTDPIGSSNVPCWFVRRMTGGGTVEHGEDVTFALIIGRETSLAKGSAGDRYHRIHQALVSALLESAKLPAVLQGDISPEVGGACFSNPVSSDVMNAETGEKIAGGAQRRSGGNVLHQGSVRVPETVRVIDAKWVSGFSLGLSDFVKKLTPTSEIFKNSEAIRFSRYENSDWLNRY